MNETDIKKKKMSTTRGRYVRVQRVTGDEQINLVKIKVYDAQGNAYTIAGATIFPPDASFPASRLLTDGYEFVHTGPRTNKGYVEVDLGADKDITKVVIINRGDCCMDRMVGLTVIVTTADRVATYTKLIDDIYDQYTLNLGPVQGPVPHPRLPPHRRRRQSRRIPPATTASLSCMAALR